MRVLAVSDLHLDAGAAEALVAAAPGADLVIAAGDFAQMHEGLEGYMARLAPIAERMICVPGNNETEEALRDATETLVLHGESVEWGGLVVAGLGGGIPPLPPMAWQSWDLTEEEADAALAPIEAADILVFHSPPAGLGDNHASLGPLGSTVLKRHMLRLAPRLCVWGHIHDCWGEGGTIAGTAWCNLGPRATWFDL